MLSYMLSYSHTRLSTSRFTLSRFCTRSLSLLNSHCPAFAFALSGFSTNTVFSIPLSFPALSRTCSANARGHGYQGLFHETIHLKRPTTIEPTIPRLSRYCLWFDRYLRPFAHDITQIPIGPCLRGSVVM